MLRRSHGALPVVQDQVSLEEQQELRLAWRADVGSISLPDAQDECARSSSVCTEAPPSFSRPSRLRELCRASHVSPRGSRLALVDALLEAAKLPRQRYVGMFADSAASACAFHQVYDSDPRELREGYSVDAALGEYASSLPSRELQVASLKLVLSQSDDGGSSGGISKFRATYREFAHEFFAYEREHAAHSLVRDSWQEFNAAVERPISAIKAVLFCRVETGLSRA